MWSDNHLCFPFCNNRSLLPFVLFLLASSFAQSGQDSECQCKDFCQDDFLKGRDLNSVILQGQTLGSGDQNSSRQLRSYRDKARVAVSVVRHAVHPPCLPTFLLVVFVSDWGGLFGKMFRIPATVRGPKAWILRRSVSLPRCWVGIRYTDQSSFCWWLVREPRLESELSLTWHVKYTVQVTSVTFTEVPNSSIFCITMESLKYDVLGS